MPATAKLQAERDAAAASLAQLPAVAEATREKAIRLLNGLDLKLAMAQRRDAIQALRPAGCWCLGLGGEEYRYLPPVDDGDAVQVWGRHCSCPEGVAAKAHDELERAHYQANRNKARVRRLFDGAQVPPRLVRATFETYPASDATADAVGDVRAWADDSQGSRSLLLYGEYGRGKTGLAVAAMRQRMAQGECEGLFITVPDLLDRIRATYTNNRTEQAEVGSEREVLDAVRTIALLVLDDLGAERATGWVQEKLFAIINARYDANLPTIFTSNLDPAGLAAHLGERTAWRIVEMCDVLHLDGPNLRDRKA